MPDTHASRSGLAEPHPPGDPDAPWAALAQAGNAEQLCHAWLSVLCTMLPGVHAALLLMQQPDGSFAPAAMWPAGRDLNYLGDIAQEALVKRQGVLQHAGDAGGAGGAGNSRFAYPLEGKDTLFGAVVVDLPGTGHAPPQQAMRMLHWGAGWLVDLHDRDLLRQQAQRLERSHVLFDLSLAALSEADFHQSALTTVNQLAQRFGCHRVQLGLEKGRTVQVAVVSHSANFDEKTNLANLAALAMNEAFDQRATLVLPEPEDGGTLITSALRRYAAEAGTPCVCALPLEAQGDITGVWMLEREAPFTPEDIDALETLALSLAPVLALQRTADQGLWRHARQRSGRLLQRFTDTSRPGLKLLIVAAATVVALLAWYPAQYRVSSRAVIEGAIQRVVAAPFQGYVREAPARAGDIVHQGQVLAVLEDKDLQLERVRWESELEVAVRKEREAMAKADRVAMRLASAQANQARAQRDLAVEKLSRVQLTAPFDGVVVRGDLSQELGSPVEQGKVLFEIAPLDTWRVTLKVDERDIAHLRTGAPGELVLTSVPGAARPLHVRRITPVSIPEEGRNYFRVEAELAPQQDAAAFAQMRPGMEGVAKVEAGERSLLWIWTHRFTDWLRLKRWEWLP